MTSYIYKLWYGENSSATAHGESRRSSYAKGKDGNLPVSHEVPVAGHGESPVQKQNTSLVYPLYDDVQKLRVEVERVLKFEDTLLDLEHKIERVQVKFKSIEERMKAIERMAGV